MQPTSVGLTCAFCPKPATTRDHIPPAGMFAEPRPSNLITVPACQVCNHGTHLDDEYFLRIALEYWASSNPEAREVAKAVLRGMEREKAKKSRNAFLKAVRFVQELRTRSGLYVGPGYTYPLDFGRILNTVRKIAKGMFFHVTGGPLPPGYSVEASRDIDFWEALRSSGRKELLQQAAFLLTQPESVIGTEVFSYRYFIEPTDPNTISWFFEFYRRMRFFALTAKAEKLRC